MTEPADAAGIGPGGVAFVTLGCKVNQAESDAIGGELRGLGVPGADDATAAVIVVNTCTVTAEADRKARKAIRHALGRPGHPIVVVTGCLAAVDPDGVAALGKRVRVVTEKERVATAVAAEVPPAPTAGAGMFTAPRGRTRAQVKVQDGCDTRCSYCIVPDARGGPRSRRADEVVAAVSALVDGGTREVVLTGINIGRYRDGDTDLASLVGRVASVGVARVRISSIEPCDVTPALLERLGSLPALCRHLHIPLQSGSDRVLAAMARPYDTRSYARTLEMARAALPGVAITTDVIAGFPGETPAEDHASREFVKACGFSRLHVFRYSARPGTPAAALPAQVDASERSRRATAMRETGEALARLAAKACLGQESELLVERVRHVSGGVEAEGTDRAYQRVVCDGGGVSPGDLLTVRLERVLEDGRLWATRPD